MIRLIHQFSTWLEGYCPSFPPEQPGKPPHSLAAFVIYYAKPFWPLLLASGLLSILISIIEVYLFSFVGNLVDWLANAERETFWTTYRYQLITIAALVLVGLPGLRLIYECTVNQGLLGNFAMRTRWQAHRYLLRQSVAFFHNDFAGRVAAKMMQTSLGVRDAVIKTTEVLLYVAVYFTSALVLFAYSDLRLTAPMLVWLTGYIVVLRYFIPRLRDISMEQAEARSMVTGRVVDSYTNIATVKMFAHAQSEDRYAREGMEIFLDNVYRQMRLSTYLATALDWLNAGLIFLIGALSIYLWQSDAITVGAIAFAMGLVMRMQGMSQWILWEIAGLFENIGVIQDGIETISQDIAITDKPNACNLSVAGGRIDFKDISFNYGKQIPQAKAPESPMETMPGGVIERFSLSVAPGEKIGLVGRSGAGKSTLVNLLLRFYDLDHGSIEIDGQNIAGVSQDTLRAAIGMVTQDTSLLHRSVYENICYGSDHTGPETVYAAARRAKAHDFILELEDQAGNKGYDAQVGERGVKLSGGQRQRVAIARVLLKDAPILVLDEATSALDSEVEAAIQESLYNLMQGKTVIAIAHRLSTIAAMDRLVVMDNGKIIETGSHQKLLEQGGLYAELWARQSGGFLYGGGTI